MCSPSRVTSAVPSSIAISSREKPPSVTTSVPSETSFDSANVATCFSSSSEASENSGIRFSWLGSKLPPLVAGFRGNLVHADNVRRPDHDFEGR